MGAGFSSDTQCRTVSQDVPYSLRVIDYMHEFKVVCAVHFGPKHSFFTPT
jgi:hypothetical protein